jgi:hypothetical protein
VFTYCEGLKHLRIPSSVVEIGASAFACCIQLLSVNLLGNLRTTESNTFFSCSSLRHVRIPSSVTRIESGAFANCTRLISLELPEGLETVTVNVEIDVDITPTIYRCLSLVNLVIPSEQDFEQYDGNKIMQGLKLRHVASNFDDLVSKLQHRFDDLPVHRLCYYQSYYPLMEAMDNLRQSMLDTDPVAGNKVDAFGMTPFHILALSQTPNLFLFHPLMKVYKVDIILTRDKFGSTPLDYLFLNHTSEATTVIRSLLTIVAERVLCLGLVRWKSEMFASIDEALATEFSSRRSAIGTLCFKLATYERLESVSLLELALWKVKIDSCKALYETDQSHLDGVDRQSCRINSGAEVVIRNVLPFLDKVCSEDYCDDSEEDY